ncbi:MAG: phosphate signaling complex protein PhoU [Pseudomonadota bacterium]|nr:phosphate signaling complex protein PhoU [Pseudomonadota bacterium]
MLDMQLLVQRKREELRQGVLQMGESVTAALRKSIECLRRQDLELARQIIDEDRPINQQRRMLEQECLVVLAAYQPAGHDLREIGASRELVSELERIADHAADVAQIVLDVGDETLPAEPMGRIAGIAGIAEEATAMVAAALAAYRAGDAEEARTAAARDDAVDARERETIENIISLMREDAEFSTAGTRMLWAVHHYERVADRATNICERVIYAATGETPDLD